MQFSLGSQRDFLLIFGMQGFDPSKRAFHKQTRGIKPIYIYMYKQMGLYGISQLLVSRNGICNQQKSACTKQKIEISPVRNRALPI